MHVSAVFQQAFQAIEDSPKPVTAAMAGHVPGGALELALACHFRLAAEGSRFSMPEVNLGINPGSGGTQRLPRLIGLEAALEMLLGGRPIDAGQALRWGLIDAICPAAELLQTAADFPASNRPIRKTRLRSVTAHGDCPNFRPTKMGLSPSADQAASRALLARAETQLAAGRPELIAPRKILEAVRAGVEDSFQAGLRNEQIVFSQCMASRATQNKIYVFCASRHAPRVPEIQGLAPLRISAAGVLGMGTMGSGIAQALLTAGLNVTACDLDEAALQAGTQRIGDSLARRVAQGKLAAAKAQSALARLAATTDWQPLAGAQLVVEAVFEDIAVKRAAIARLEEICPAETIIATNTSTIDLDLLAAGMRHPGRLVGMHFFHPAQQMPLVEVVRRPATRPEVVATALAVVKAMGKTPVVVENRAGFVVNRLFIPYLMEAFWLLEEGTGPAEVDRAMVDFGFAMGPLQLIDMSGLDILKKTHAVMRQAFPQHGDLSPIACQLVDEGRLGQKTGAGVYRYEPGDRTPRPHGLTEQAVAAARRRRGPAAVGLDREQIVSRLMLRMVAEAFSLVEEGIVRRPADVDVAMVLGTGLADFRGGVLKYACDLGLEHVLTELRRLARQYGPRYEPCALLEQAAADPAGSLPGVYKVPFPVPSPSGRGPG
jgi:3-hydroxyacyl-CoA dehydrogenase